MGWKVKLGGDKEVDFDDLSPDVFVEIAKEDDNDDISWWGVYNFPGANPDRLYRTIQACAKHAGVDSPDEPTDMRTARQLLEMLAPGPNIEHLPQVGEFPPMPDAPENGSTSGAPGDSDGPEMKREDSLSASS